MNDADYLKSQHKRLTKLIRKRTGEQHMKILNVVVKFDISMTRRMIQEELNRRDRPVTYTTCEDILPHEKHNLNDAFVCVGRDAKDED